MYPADTEAGATVRTDDGHLEVEPEVQAGRPDLLVRADTRLRLAIANGRRSPGGHCLVSALNRVAPSG